MFFRVRLRNVEPYNLLVFLLPPTPLYSGDCRLLLDLRVPWKVPVRFVMP